MRLAAEGSLFFSGLSMVACDCLLCWPEDLALKMEIDLISVEVPFFALDRSVLSPEMMS